MASGPPKGQSCDSEEARPNLVIPMHRTLAPFLLRNQIRRAGLTEEQFLRFLK